MPRGRPILGTCAGMIVCDRDHLALLDATCRRNAFGRQLASFEADLEITGLGPEPVRAVFIRAPWIESMGPEWRCLPASMGIQWWSAKARSWPARSIPS